MSDTVKESVARSMAETMPNSEPQGCDKAEGRDRRLDAKAKSTPKLSRVEDQNRR